MAFTPATCIVECGGSPQRVNGGDTKPQQPLQLKARIEEMRRETAKQAARDVVKLLPLSAIHHCNGAHFVIYGPTGGSTGAPTLRVYVVDTAVKGVTKDSGCTDLSSRGMTLGAMLPGIAPLLTATREEISRALRAIQPDLQVMWEEDRVYHDGEKRHVFLT